jgi:ADP-heptose:LPS heptosyltransferase
MLVNSKPIIRTQGQIQPYTQSTPVLKNLDRMLKEGKPNICITRKQGGIGDVLMTLPTVKALAKKYNTKIDYGTCFDYLDGALAKVLEGNPYIRKVIPWRDVDPTDYNAVLDLTCPCVHHEKPLARPINRSDLFARYLGIKLDDHDIEYMVTEEERQWAKEYLQDNGLNRFKLILVQPTSSTSRRDAPLDKIQKALIQIMQTRRDIRALIITHETDHTKTDWNFQETHVLNNFDVRHIAAIMEQTDLVLCPDSAVLHLAAALHHPTVTLFGPTDPYARVNYHPEAVAIWPGKELKNYPVWYQDPKDGYLCWKRLEVSDITKTCLAKLTGSPLPESRDLVTFGSHEHHNQYYEIV